MSHTVFCRRHKRELPGLDAPPFPGPEGEEIYRTVSRQAWEEWLAHQTRLINERRLNLRDAAARRYLEEQRRRFLAGEPCDDAGPPRTDGPGADGWP
ncbi:MAG: putative Fe(2+)-trafficking protein [Porticoccaceae bacterium]|nr:MAG: putative Fe(2+)-trafficking protein [Porticoccaceae bacterium]